jgi:hypothetical protein
MHVRARFFAFSLLLSSLLGCSKSSETSTTTTTSNPAPSAAASADPAVAAPKKAAAPIPDSPAGVISCQQKALCAEWSGLTLGELKEAKESCNDPGARFGSGACPRKNVMGICRHRDAKVTMYIYKSIAVANAKDAKEICDDGEFTPAK